MPVEERLIAAGVNKPEEPDEPEHRPQINPNSERILNRKGPSAPVEDRLRQSTGRLRDGAGHSEEIAECHHVPTISAGTRRLLSRKPRDGGDVQAAASLTSSLTLNT